MKVKEFFQIINEINSNEDYFNKINPEIIKKWNITRVERTNGNGSNSRFKVFYKENGKEKESVSDYFLSTINNSNFDPKKINPRDNSNDYYFNKINPEIIKKWNITRVERTNGNGSNSRFKVFYKENGKEKESVSDYRLSTINNSNFDPNRKHITNENSQIKEIEQEKDIKDRTKNNQEYTSNTSNKKVLDFNSYKVGSRALNKQTGEERSRYDLSDEEKQNYTNSSDIGFDLNNQYIRMELKNHETINQNTLFPIIDLIEAGNKNPSMRTFGVLMKNKGITYNSNSSSLLDKEVKAYTPGQINLINNMVYRITDNEMICNQLLIPLTKFCYFSFSQGFGETVNESIDNLSVAKKLFPQLERVYNKMAQMGMATAAFTTWINRVRSKIRTKQVAKAASVNTSRFFNY